MIAESCTPDRNLDVDVVEMTRPLIERFRKHMGAEWRDCSEGPWEHCVAKMGREWFNHAVTCPNNGHYFPKSYLFGRVPMVQQEEQALAAAATAATASAALAEAHCSNALGPPELTAEHPPPPAAGPSGIKGIPRATILEPRSRTPDRPESVPTPHTMQDKDIPPKARFKKAQQMMATVEWNDKTMTFPITVKDEIKVESTDEETDNEYNEGRGEKPKGEKRESKYTLPEVEITQTRSSSKKTAKARLKVDVVDLVSSESDSEVTLGPSGPRGTIKDLFKKRSARMMQVERASEEEEGDPHYAFYSGMGGDIDPDRERGRRGKGKGRGKGRGRGRPRK